MATATTIRRIFAHFQNLNLLVLLDDLRCGYTAREDWSNGDTLCPVAHGMPSGRDVELLLALAQYTDLRDSCLYAAQQVGADEHAIYRFVCDWDERLIPRETLYDLLHHMWCERLDDAVAMQDILQESFGPTSASRAAPARG